jgi:ubiquinol-cytochrome c reductase cytochrome b subunit
MIEWIGRTLGRWLDRRVGGAKFFRRVLNHVFPDHWSFMLGEIALYCFMVLVLTGIFLMMFFHDSSTKEVYHGSYRALDGLKMSDAYISVLHISFDVKAGLLIRQMHHWAALLFIGAILVHAMRIFFTAAYRRPREINWIIGLTLLLLALGNGFFGYSLPGDLLSGLGLRVGYSILLSFPVIGSWLAFLLFGSTVPSSTTLPRFYSLHIFFVPALIALLLAVHLGIIWRQYHTNYPGPKRTNDTIVGSRLYPSYAAKSIGLFFLVLGFITALGGLAQIDPVWVYGPFDPTAATPFAQPDWYLGWIEGAMRLNPAYNLRLGHYLVPNIFFPALLLPLLIFAVLYAYPFLDKFISWDDRPHNVLKLPYQQPFNTALGCTVLSFLLILFLAGGDDVIAVATSASVVTIRRILRLLAITLPPLIGIIVYWLCKRAQRRSLAAHAVAGPETAESPGNSEALPSEGRAAKM